MKCFLVLCLFAVLISKNTASTPYVVTIGEKYYFEVYSFDNETRAFTMVEKQAPVDETFFANTACMDPETQTLYYAGGNFLYAANVLKKTEASYKWNMWSVSGMMWDRQASQILMVVSYFNDINNYYLAHYPPNGGQPTNLLNLTAMNINELVNEEHYNAFDDVNRVFYIVNGVDNANGTASGYFEVQQFNLNDSTNITTIEYKCAYMLSQLVYDTVNKILVGVAYNMTKVPNSFPLMSVFAVTLDNGICTSSPLIMDNSMLLVDTPSAAYDANSATWYISYSTNAGFGLRIFNTKTNQIIDVPHTFLIYDIALGD